MSFKIYTKGGDKGQTSLLGGRRVDKDHLRIEAYGTLDELNSFVGLLKDAVKNKEVQDQLLDIQSKLFVIGSHLAKDPETSRDFKLPEFPESNTIILEQAIDAMDEKLKPLTSFILPGGTIHSSYAHLCRSISRRAERRMVTLVREDKSVELYVQWMNRLSDYFFTLARYILVLEGGTEIEWRS